MMLHTKSKPISPLSLHYTTIPQIDPMWENSFDSFSGAHCLSSNIFNLSIGNDLSGLIVFLSSPHSSAGFYMTSL